MATVKPRDASPSLARTNGPAIAFPAIATLVHNHRATNRPDAADGRATAPSAARFLRHDHAPPRPGSQSVAMGAGRVSA